MSNERTDLDYLTDRELELYEFIRLHGYEKDVKIAAIHDKLYSDTNDTLPRTPQQRVGAIISKVNKKLSGERITPGELKQTYRLTARQ